MTRAAERDDRVWPAPTSTLHPGHDRRADHPPGTSSVRRASKIGSRTAATC